jgi:glycosyltransferase involved in cell wall biosynthesis
VGEAIDSALGQTYPDVEVVVVDDGSTDGSVKVLERYAAEHPPERFRFEAGPNRGGCAARNRALELSRGQFVNFLDADDVLEPTKIEKQLPQLVEDKADCVLSLVGLIWPPPRPRAPEKKPHPNPAGHDPFMYLAKFPLQTAAPLHRRSLIEKIGGFRVGLRRGQEREMHLRLGATNLRLAMVEEPLIWVRMHDGPRVSKQKPDPAEQLSAILGVADFMDRLQTRTPERDRWLAEQLHMWSTKCLEAGDVSAARRGMELATRLDPHAHIRDSSLKRIIRTALGPYWSECLFQRLSRVRRSLSA